MGNQQITDEEELRLLNQLLDLSVAELMILQFMTRYNTPIMRNVLLETLNQTFANGKTIGSSSFYNMINKLNERNFIAYDDEKRIQVTKGGQTALSVINRVTAMASVDSVSMVQSLLPDFAAVSGIVPGDIEKMLIINLEAGMDIRMMHSIASFSQTCYIAADDAAYTGYLNRGMPPSIKQSRLGDGMVREANDYFDGIVVLGYDCNITYRSKPTREWLYEAYRVLKPNGLITISSLEELPITNHFLADGIIDNLRMSNIMHNIGQEDLMKELEAINILDGQIFNHNGLLIGWGRKSV